MEQKGSNDSSSSASCDSNTTAEGVNLRDEVDVESWNEGVHNDHLILKLKSGAITSIRFTKIDALLNYSQEQAKLNDFSVVRRISV